MPSTKTLEQSKTMARQRTFDIQAKCADIRRMLELLNDEFLESQDRSDISSALKLVESRTTSALIKATKQVCTWDRILPEIKNEIYRYVLQSGARIKTRPCWKRVDGNPKFERHGLGGQLLRCSKAIYREALPIFLKEHVFEIDQRTLRYLSLDAPPRPVTSDVLLDPASRASLIQKAIVKANKAHYPTTRKALQHFRGLKELTVYADGTRYLYSVATPRAGAVWTKFDIPNLAKEAFSRVKAKLLAPLRSMCPSAKYYFQFNKYKEYTVNSRISPA